MSNKKIYQISLKSSEQDELNFQCGEDQLILEAARAQGIYLANYCKQGACGACSAKLVSGSVNYVRAIKGAPQEPEAGDTVRPCSLNACSDLILEPLSAWRTSDE